jgi:hypothetical protein
LSQSLALGALPQAEPASASAAARAAQAREMAVGQDTGAA